MEVLKSLADSGGYRSWIWLELREREVKREVSEAGEVSGLCELDEELKHYPVVAVAVGRNPYQTNSSKKEMSRFIKLLSSGLNYLHAPESRTQTVSFSTYFGSAFLWVCRIFCRQFLYAATEDGSSSSRPSLGKFFSFSFSFF